MLSEPQVTQVWDSMISAETRALYFASLASRYSAQKQWISGASFFLSSGIVVILLAKLPSAVAVCTSFIIALLSAYSIAVNLDRKMKTMVKLHSQWQAIATDYNYLWNHPYNSDSESKLEEIIKHEREPSEVAATEAPNDEERMGKWQKRVFTSYHLS
jgi:hypothetical protein